MTARRRVGCPNPRWQRWGGALLGTLLAAGLLAACAGSDESGEQAATPDAADYVVAAYNFNESKVLASVYAQALEAAGVPAAVLLLTNREIVVPALRKRPEDTRVGLPSRRE